MYLDTWMIAVVVFMYGVCHLVSWKAGHWQGLNEGMNLAYVKTLQELAKAWVIRVEPSGEILPIQYVNGEKPKGGKKAIISPNPFTKGLDGRNSR